VGPDWQLVAGAAEFAVAVVFAAVARVAATATPCHRREGLGNVSKSSLNGNVNHNVDCFEIIAQSS
jgi:hypothetical protein